MKIERVRFVDYVPLKGGAQALDATSTNYRLEYEPAGIGVLASWAAGATLIPWGNVRSVSLTHETGFETGYAIGMKPVSPTLAPDGAGMVNAKVADVMGTTSSSPVTAEPAAEVVAEEVTPAAKRRGRPRKGYVLD